MRLTTQDKYRMQQYESDGTREKDRKRSDYTVSKSKPTSRPVSDHFLLERGHRHGRAVSAGANVAAIRKPELDLDRAFAIHLIKIKRKKTRPPPYKTARTKIKISAPRQSPKILPPSRVPANQRRSLIHSRHYRRNLSV